VSASSAEGFRGWFLENMAMYMAYHRDARNHATHHVGVPLIVFSILLALSQVHLVSLGDVPITAASVVLALLLITYIAALPFTGVFAAIFYGVVYVAVSCIAMLSDRTVWSVAGGAFVLGWVIQFVGHAFEGRRPAFMDNLLQVFMAPPFLIAHMLFALGLEKDLNDELRLRATKYFSDIESR
jgi:uncharacterized membrane protein YGL010W